MLSRQTDPAQQFPSEGHAECCIDGSQVFGFISHNERVILLRPEGGEERRSGPQKSFNPLSSKLFRGEVFAGRHPLALLRSPD